MLPNKLISFFKIAAEQYLAETKRRKRAVGDEFYENFFALHGEYPKAFVSGPGIYGVGVQGKFCQEPIIKKRFPAKTKF